MLTHGLHPYPAKFIPHIPRRVIELYGRVGGVVWDPMAGSGTTLVEAAVAGMTGIGTDINPVATLISRAKTQPLDESARKAIEKLQADVARTFSAVQAAPESIVNLAAKVPIPDFPKREHWFGSMVTRELALIKDAILRYTGDRAADLALTVFSAIIVGVSFQESETRWRAVRSEWDPGRALDRFLSRLRGALDAVKQFSELQPAACEVRTEDARRARIEPGTIDLVMTSPPYANSHDYYLYNKLRMFWLGEDVGRVQVSEIGSRNRHSDKKEPVDTYLTAMREILGKVRRSLRPDGYAVFVVGNAVIRGEFFDMGVLLPEIASEEGLALEHHGSFSHRRFNSTFTPGFGHEQKRLTNVLVFRPVGRADTAK